MVSTSFRGAISSFRHFGGLAALGVGIAFLVTFTLLPALLYLHLRRSSTRSRARASALPDEILAAVRDTLRRYPRSVLAACLGGFALLATGVPRLHYASDFGFGEQSFVVDLRAIEANFRKPMTTEVVGIATAAHVYDAASLGLLARIEALFAAEPTTGGHLGFLDLLEDAHRVDRGRSPADFDELVADAPRTVALVASTENARWFWKVAIGDGERERARVSVDRAWLDDAAQTPYVARVRDALTAIEHDAAPGTRIEFEGGLVLADRFVSQLRDTRWKASSRPSGWSRSR
jgi:hypothetical protein